MGTAKNDAYKRILRFPYCCNGCPKKYFECHFINKSIFFYDALNSIYGYTF